MNLRADLLLSLNLLQVVNCIVWSGITPRPIPFPPTPSTPSTPGNQVVLAACGSTLTVQQGVTYLVASPGYPAPYTPFTYCRWTFFSGSISERLFVTCQDFDIEASSSCPNGAFLALQDPAQGFQWFCGSVGPQTIASITRPLTLHFWASWQNNNNKKGFSCAVTTNPLTPSTGDCRCGRIATSTRVVGGKETGVHEFPWQALVRIPSGFCGGALINERFVLTAAHCIDQNALPAGALPEVVLGEHDRTRLDETPYTQVVAVSRVIPHENYGFGPSSKDNDIGLIELATNVDLEATPNIAPVCPPGNNIQFNNLPVTVIGWGFTNYPGARADALQKVDLVMVSREICKDQYQADVITDNMICAAASGKDACFDDSGGPLMTRVGQHWQVIGVVSFGPSTCASPDVAGVFTKVANYIPWILSKIGNTRTCPPAS
ncbi:trypsin-1-like [Homarus americanus]|uniref:trypsin-1-like n=1 Tax=Homarus americanus TaxID=6706 RepID=UPI001C47858B|nr:trypsin-1-like [Homarus americanus]XP_042210686.1 trypsin-1-like [Homarus americanus]